jgi:hypothetical protein
VSLVNVSVWMLPRPDHDPTLCQMETSRGGRSDRDRHPASTSTIAAIAAADIGRIS